MTDWARASGAVLSRIRALPEYSAFRSAVIAAIVEKARDRDVSAMREIGGFSRVAERAIGGLPESAHANRGSALLPYSIADVLRFEMSDMVELSKRELRGTR